MKRYVSRKNRTPRRKRGVEEYFGKEGSEGFIRDVLDSVANAIFVYDLEEKKFVYVNEFIRNLLGYTPSEIKAFGVGFWDKITDPRYNHLKVHLKEVPQLKDGEVKTIITKLKHADGSWKWFMLRDSVFSRTGAGSVKAITGTILDVTEKVTEVRQIQHNLTFIDKVINSSPFDVFVYDVQEERNIYVNSNVITSLGYSAREVQDIGIGFLQRIIYPEDKELFQRKNDEIKQLGLHEAIKFDFRVIASDGTVKWLCNELSVFSMDEKGTVKEVLCVTIDITEKREREEYLRDNIYFINKIAETLPNYFFIEDLESDTIVFSNRSILEDLGYVEEFKDLMNEFWKIIHPDDLPILVRTKAQLKYLGDKTIREEFRLRHANGSWRWMYVIVCAFKKDQLGNVLQIIASCLDITERKEAELSLKESQHFIQSILDTSPNSIYIYDLEKKSNIYSARSTSGDLGYSDGYIQSLGENFMTKLLHPDDFEHNIKHWKELETMKDGEVKSVEGRLKHADGTWRWFHLRHGVFKRDEKGKVVQVIGIATDITNLKKTEKQLEESKAFVTKIMEANPNVIVIYDLMKQMPVYINRYVRETLGYAPEEILVMGPDALNRIIHPDDRPKLLYHLNRVVSVDHGNSKSIEYRAKDKQGNYHWLLSMDSVFERDEKGRVIKVIAAITEITDRKIIEEEIKRLNVSLEEAVNKRTRELRLNQEQLAHREQQLTIIINSVPALISYLDTNLLYVFANNHYYKVFNIAGTISGKHISEVLGEENYRSISPMINKALAGEEVTFESSFYNKNNERLYYKLSYKPVWDNRGKITGLIVMGADLTDRYNYERSLEERNTELVKINSELDNFVYTASHDLKSPIVNMEGLLKSLLEEASTRCEDDINEMLNYVMLSVEKLKNTIEELSEISRIQKGIESYEEDVNIEEILTDFMVEYSEQIKASKAVISSDLSVPVIKFSQKNFRSVLYNLLSNAIKFRSPKRTPVILVKSEYAQNNYVKITISDNGMGFDMRKKDKVFGMFKRLHAHVEGTGVGMYIVKRIMENASGKIEVESREGEGSTFKLYFPIR
jgi:PAS domain S-box-containing protein